MQKMSEKDAIFVLKRIEAHGPLPIKAKEVAIQALEEIQQYRATGMTPEQIKEMQMDYCAKGAVLEEYQAIGTVEEIRQKLAELERWRTNKVNPKIKNVFANTSTLICHNCDHKDEYIEELEAQVEICREAVERMKPKKPIKRDGSPTYYYYECPTCHDYDVRDQRCCDNCGQRLLWEE